MATEIKVPDIGDFKDVPVIDVLVKEGDAVKVKLLGFDNRGKVRLSMKAVDQQTGEDLSKKQQQQPAEEQPIAEASGE